MTSYYIGGVLKDDDSTYPSGRKQDMRLPGTQIFFLTLMFLGGLCGQHLVAAQAPGSATQAVPDESEDQPPRYEETVDVEAEAPPEGPVNLTGMRMPVPALLTPASVSVVPDVLLRQQEAQILGDGLRNVSGVNVATGFGVHDYFVVRGMDSIRSGLVLIDGAPEPEATFYPLYNVERVEVLKGPATFLYGGNPLAGAVQLVREQPAERRFAAGSFSYGSFETIEGRLDLNAGRSDGSLAFRLNGLYRGSDGYRDDKHSRLAAVNPSVAWLAAPELRLTADLEYVRAEFSPDSGLPVVGGDLPDVPRTRSYQGPFDRSVQDIYRLRLDAEWRVGERFTLRNKLYYTDLDWTSDGTLLSGVFPGPSGRVEVARSFVLLDDRQRLWGNQAEALLELSTGAVGHKLLVGLEISRFADEFQQDVALLPSIDLLEPVETATWPPFLLPGLSVAGDARNLVLAPYVVDHISFSPKLRLLVGARLDWLDYEDPPNAIERSDQRLSPMAGLLFAPTPGWSLYANAAGGFAPPSTLALGDRAPEESRQLEIGAKKAFLGGRGLATLALYDLRKDNIAIPDSSGVLRRQGDQRSRGLEVEVSAHTTDGWHALAVYALNDAELTRFADQVLVGLYPPTYVTVDRSGNTAAFAPRHLLSLWAQKRFSGGLGLGLGLRYVGSQFIAEDNAFAIDDYVTVDAHASFERGGWRASLRFENLTDTRYETRGFGTSSVIPGKPFAFYATLELSLGSRR